MATNATVTCTNDVGKLCTLLGFPTLDSPEQLQMVREHLDRQVLAILESIQEGILVHFLANVLLEAKPSGDHRFKVEKKPSSIPGSGDGTEILYRYLKFVRSFRHRQSKSRRCGGDLRGDCLRTGGHVPGVRFCFYRQPVSTPLAS